MIEILEGFGVGAGKSYFATTKLIQHFIEGGTAYVSDTMQLKWPEFKAYVARKYDLLLEDSQYSVVESDKITQIHEHTPPGTPDNPVLIVVDECHGALNARDWADKSKRALFDWCTQSRHDDNDLLFISQSAANIDKQLRRIATYNWRVRNSEKLGDGNPLKLWLNVWKWISFGTHGGAQFIVSQLDQDGQTLLGKKTFIPQDKEIFSIYESKAMRGKHRRAGVAVARLKLKRASGEKKRSKFMGMLKYAMIGIVVVLCLAGYRISKTDWSFGHGKTKPQGSAVQSPASASTKGGENAYDLESEPWRSRGRDWVRCASGTYKIGRMSKRGMVEMIADGVIRIRKPDSRLLYIVTEDVSTADARQAVRPTPEDLPSATVSSAPVAHVSPTVWPDHDIPTKRDMFADVPPWRHDVPNKH